MSPILVPPRSRLIGLTPIGTGTGLVESLWGYLQRLASAHSVRLIDLLKEFNAPFTRDSARGPVLKGGLHGVSAANGSIVGYRFAKWLESVTNRCDLDSLTLRGISDIPGLSVKTRNTYAWCPECLKEDSEPHDRLLWSLADVTHCPKHGSPLTQNCAHCARAPRLFSINSSILRCDRCGGLKSARASREDEAKALEGFGLWQSRQLEQLLGAVSGGNITTREFDVRAHNIRMTMSLPQIRGVTGLGPVLGLGRTTCGSWLNHDRSFPLKIAVRWAWITETNLVDLFSKKLPLEAFSFRPLPEASRSRPRLPYRPAVGADSTALYLATLRLAAANPFVAPKISQLESESGVHKKHLLFREVHFRRLIAQLRERERVFQRKVNVWRVVSNVHEAARRVVAKKLPLGRHRVEVELDDKSCMGGSLGRNYVRWLKDRLAHRDTRVLSPKRVPLDVRSYWDFTKKGSGTS